MQTRFSDDILLVGTAHVSKKSVAEVREAIIDFQPDVVAVELDKSRFDALTNPKRWEELSVIDVLRSGKGFLVMVQVFLAMVQRRMGEEFGSEPGKEMITALCIAKEFGIEVALVDREITTTFRRGWRSMRFIEKWRIFIYSTKALVGYDSVEMEEDFDPDDLKEDIITMMIEELRAIAPSITTAFIDERDAYISKRILECSQGKGLLDEKEREQIVEMDEPKKRKVKVKKGAKKVEERASKQIDDKEREEAKKKDLKKKRGVKKGRKVLAVLGAGHLKGVERNLKDPEKIPPLEKLDEIPKKKFSTLKVVGYSIPVIFIAIFAWMIYNRAWEAAAAGIFWWFLINGTFSAVGALIARGHPLTIGTAFAAAPFTSLNPAIGAGWVAGYVEAKIRTPTVKDMKKLSTVADMKEFFNNRFIRVLFVASLANVGSAIGTFVALPYVARIGIFG